MEREWYLYKGKRYHKVGEMYCAGNIKVMLLPEEIEELHLNHEHLLIVHIHDVEGEKE